MRRRHSTYQGYNNQYQFSTPKNSYHNFNSHVNKYYRQSSPFVNNFLTQNETKIKTFYNQNNKAHYVSSFDSQNNTNLKQQLRKAIQLSQQDKLTAQLHKQMNSCLQLQIERFKKQNQNLKLEMTKFKLQNSKLIKKLKLVKQSISNNKNNKKCQQCKKRVEDQNKFQRQRDIYLKQRQLLQNQIKDLHDKVNQFWNNSEIDDLVEEVQTLRKQLQQAYQKITLQQRIITKSSQQNLLIKNQRQKLTFDQIHELEDKIDQLQLQNTLLKSDKKTLNSNSFISGSNNSKGPFFSNSKQKASLKIFDRSISENQNKQSSI